MKLLAKWAAGVAGMALIGLSGVALAGLPMSPLNSLPNPYQTIDNWLKMPQGQNWGSTAGIDIAPDGKSVWVIDRCGSNGCVGSALDPILKFDANGNLLKSWDSRKCSFPHAIFVDGMRTSGSPTQCSAMAAGGSARPCRKSTRMENS